MIASLRGEVRHIGLDHVVVECAGVGYKVLVAPATAGALTRGSEGSLLTSMVVREDSMTLYGFTDSPQQELFHLLQTVQGVGPRLAMAAIAVLEPAQMQSAIASGDIKTLCLIPGIGKRVAERIHIELKDKVAAPSTSVGQAGTSNAPSGGTAQQLLDALEGLGFTPKQAEPAVAAAVEAGPDKPVSELLRDALKSLGRG
ncbi:Holliday junction branch migration complex subunit RuvA OS=Tsukamurella paurometabola (strain ATCC 8368 / DSM / CCUG 35730 / CIP 100753 / JCM 10117 / KCTC 9821 / NBRC 16120 / NCIMB 702349 / NCTC 13040) OX=521096 GN=ruvA PE=3 SV=1 [Tsukamurella paurometabola]|uniref:Holliday junction branch migration complex subunit RuvA n=1 Tax=Tsukamurella paurometabola (strain ATCC 8368 / DSM 20162 / CCUG 35730 / CIP 100753 / JCM 10117 / KCTC 9821 / NBRC 16120 / NCIMB 702349 / NCTC 13040) TaxID=521096 RepID=D5UN51_TSUPD|nr:Holliday junction branch migration protein RuvA [Tsukamurella paurometabola]ADG78548.1 Holliday junction DNA helicase RuvA [Tsukamurella paurometabola DSM 20162]SUP32131.1 Holliday junction ATP-dependent DNA helicase RuvA [Tsukamurella paurometabola]